MSAINDGGSAFPFGDYTNEGEQGMRRRLYQSLKLIGKSTTTKTMKAKSLQNHSLPKKPMNTQTQC